MQLLLQSDLIFLEQLTVIYEAQSLIIENVLVDTGSAGTVFDTDLLLTIGIKPALDDIIRTVYGISGEEYVFERSVTLGLEGNLFENVTIQVGQLGYGITGIIGLDFLRHIQAVIDLKNLTLSYE